ncbi:MAG: hypothetical protein QOE89_1823 [Pseudonocardiales bacterium]|nr:hypothetical protein [Pseudonocardiales bacterium]
MTTSPVYEKGEWRHDQQSGGGFEHRGVRAECSPTRNDHAQQREQGDESPSPEKADHVPPVWSVWSGCLSRRLGHACPTIRCRLAVAEERCDLRGAESAFVVAVVAATSAAWYLSDARRECSRDHRVHAEVKIDYLGHSHSVVTSGSGWWLFIRPATDDSDAVPDPWAATCSRPDLPPLMPKACSRRRS